MNTKDNPIILSKNIAACGIMSHDDHDILLNECVISVEYLEAVLKHAKQEIKEYRTKQGNKKRIDQTKIELRLYQTDVGYSTCPYVHMRFKADEDPVVPNDPNRFYAIAPVVNTERFKEYDQNYTDSLIEKEQFEIDDSEMELYKNGMFREEPLAGSNVDTADIPEEIVLHEQNLKEVIKTGWCSA